MITYITKYNSLVTDKLSDYGISCKVLDNGMISVNRTSAHNAKIMKGLKEWDIIHMLKFIIEDAIPEIGCHISTATKTDDDWFYEIWKV